MLPIIKYSDDDEAISRANNSDLGLGGSVWSKDIATANALANQIESGTVWVRTCRPDTCATNCSALGKLAAFGVDGSVGTRADLFCGAVTSALTGQPAPHDDGRSFRRL